MSTAGGPAVVDGPLVLADISGYSAFLRMVQEAHAHDAFANGRIPDAYAVMSTLLDGIVARLAPPFTVSKLEGDAVFAFAESYGDVPRGDTLLDCVRACHAGFRETLAGVEDVWTCGCDACARIHGLDLKFVLHAGRFVMQPMAGARELIGPEVVVAHRLLKTRAAEVAGGGGYLLLTDAAAEGLGVSTADALPFTDTIEHHGPIDLHVFPLGA